MSGRFPLLESLKNDFYPNEMDFLKFVRYTLYILNS